jgi:hypothetical protein
VREDLPDHLGVGDERERVEPLPEQVGQDADTVRIVYEPNVAGEVTPIASGCRRVDR